MLCILQMRSATSTHRLSRGRLQPDAGGPVELVCSPIVYAPHLLAHLGTLCLLMRLLDGDTGRQGRKKFCCDLDRANSPCSLRL